MTVPTGTVSAVSQSYWSPRLYQQIPRTGQAAGPPSESSDAVSAPSHSLPCVDRQAEVGGLRHPERDAVALVPRGGLGLVRGDAVGDR